MFTVRCLAVNCSDTVLYLLERYIFGTVHCEVNLSRYAETRYIETQIDVRASEAEVHSPVNLVSIYSSYVKFDYCPINVRNVLIIAKQCVSAVNCVETK